MKIRASPADIHLRTDMSGGDVWGCPKVDLPALCSSSRTIILLHGYNVDHTTAMQSFTDFQASLVYVVPQLKGQIFTCSWPGDWWVPLIRKAGYPKLVTNAITCSGILAKIVHEICRSTSDDH